MKKSKTEFDVSPAVAEKFDVAVEMQANADLYMTRYRKTLTQAWDMFYAENPSADESPNWEYNVITKSVKKTEAK